jgi:spore coat protein H
MKNKLICLIALMLSLAFCFGGYAGVSDDDIIGDLGSIIGKDDINTEEDIHIRDKDLIYENQNNTEIVTMYLTVSSGNSAENTDHTWEEINTYSTYDYEAMGVDRYKVAGLLQVGDENGLVAGELGYGQSAPNCTVQVRGQTSSRNAQKNYKITIKDNKGDWRGQTTIALNKHQADGLRFRNKLGFDLLSGIEQLLSLRTTFVHLYVKDLTAEGEAKFEDYGIYTQVEQLNKTALESHGLDKRGHLYKINSCEFFRYEDSIVLKDDPAYDVAAFEKILEIKGNDDHSKLINLLEKINDYSIPIETILKENFDTENIAYWMAFQILVGNADTQNRNFYLYSPLNSERFYILAWDHDAMLKRSEYAVNGRSENAGWENGVSNYWGNVLFQRCLKSEFFRAELDKAVEDLYGQLLDGRLEEYVNTYSELLKPLVYEGRDALHIPLTPSQYDMIAASLTDEVRSNYENYKKSYENPMPFYIGIPTYADGKLSFLWDVAYSFDVESITYTFELARDYTFADPIVKVTDLNLPGVTFDTLPQGQYFIRVIARDEGGDTQVAFDYYVIETGKVYGTKCFYVDAEGNIVEDVYVE